MSGHALHAKAEPLRLQLMAKFAAQVGSDKPEMMVPLSEVHDLAEIGAAFVRAELALGGGFLKAHKRARQKAQAFVRKRLGRG